VRRSAFVAAPWKNGGGITHEAMRVPASGDTFRWRVSVAHIDASGPFSEFAAYRRTMVLLRGAGIELRFGDGGRKALRHVGKLVEFDGAVPVYCELLNGPCVDLNLMVCKPGRAGACVERIQEPLALRAAPEEAMLIFPIDVGVALDIEGGETAALEPWDLAVLSHGDARLAARESGTSASVFVATLRG
jgi:uncharacterized protein